MKSPEFWKAYSKKVMEKKEYRYYLKLSLQHHLCTIGITESSNGKQQRHYAYHSA
jgi:hypothetical protein